MAHSYVLRSRRQLLSDAWQLKAAAGIMYRLWSFTPFRYYASIAFLIASNNSSYVSYAASSG